MNECNHCTSFLNAYIVAKEQGYRSRAAFKLSQINRKFKILQPGKTKIVIDLCAAPGGWTQVAQKILPTSSTVIVAVDILPIRPIASNVLTLIGDITTEKCKAEIKRQLQSASADVVLCDGAPNVGAAYEKDAYVQNEIALHSLKCATEHLKKNGVFITKLYRSRDYASYVWVAKQLFHSVEAVKPSSSRSQSAEIFLVCQGYKAPDILDPRLLDPKYVFEFVENATDGGQAGGVKGGGKMNIFHEKFFEKKRQRQGYDMTKLDFTMRSLGKVADFMQGDISTGIEMLSEYTGLTFTCDVCSDIQKKDSETEMTKPSCKCAFYKNHKLTTPEIKACVSDLKVLNRSDFKGILNWKLKVLADMKALEQKAVSSHDDSNSISSVDEKDDNNNSDDDEDQIQEEIANLRHKKLREAKRKKKKERELAGKRRRRAAMALDLSQDVAHESEKIFTLAQIQTAADLEAVREINLAQMEDTDSEEELEQMKKERDDLSSQGEETQIDEETGYNYRLDRELDYAYDDYLKKTRNTEAKKGTKMDKRAKKNRKEKAKNLANEDSEIASMIETGMNDETARYTQLLNNGGGEKADSGDENNDDELESAQDSDDGYNMEPLTPQEHLAAKQRKEQNPLILTLPEEPTSVRAARWFSNPLFSTIADVAKSATKSNDKGVKQQSNPYDYDSDSDDDAQIVAQISSDEDDDIPNPTKTKTKTKSKQDSKSASLTAEEILASIPKTDKQVRHERRLKALARAERKKKRLAKLAGDDEEFQVVTVENDEEPNDPNQNMEKLKSEEQRALLKAGLGVINDLSKEKSGFDVVPADPLPKLDTREYNSENEAYDSDDQAQTLALATMTLRHSRRKALVDASYNRFAWNDPSDLPDWFVDDEAKHYRPQLPIPAALVAKMKERYMQLATKPIQKVAEARARKNKRARARLAAAKKKAEAVANSSEMTEAMKLKAISKAMRGSDAKRPGKTYVVSKKNGSAKGKKGVKLVDKRMKNDKRSMDRSTKKRKAGKKGGLTGSKRRRHHK